MAAHPTISTHAARAGGDALLRAPRRSEISTHAARAGGDASQRQ